MTATTSYKKKLIEVAIPLEAINAASAREKSIRHGHPSTLHLWWARRPLAACRAVLFAQLVDDPSSNPAEFSTKAAIEEERSRLFDIISELVIWENGTNEEVLEKARREIRKSCGGILPPVFDPFSGGGSIPLEAQRIGLPAHGSDLNPVAVVIGKAMIEIPPRFADQPPVHPGPRDRNHYRKAEGLAEDVRFYGRLIRDRALELIGEIYPSIDVPKGEGGGNEPAIAWIWARTVPSPDPAFSDTPVPLASNFMLGSKPGKEVWIQPIVDRSTKDIRFTIRKGGTKAELAAAREGTKAGRGANFLCLLSGSAITPSYIKAKAAAGELGQRLMAVVVDGRGRRIYVPPNEEHEAAATLRKAEWEPNLKISDDRRAFTPPDYGMTTFGDLFTERQLVALNTFSDLVKEMRGEIFKNSCEAGFNSDVTPLRDGGVGAFAYAEALSVYLSFVVNRAADRGSSICTWDSSPKMEALRNTFGRQALPITWDFAEGNPFSDASGNFMNNVEWVAKAVEKFWARATGIEEQSDAQSRHFPANAAISTDPPYYDNIGYADLSDFFYCWMRPILKDIYPDIFGILSTPKGEELIASPSRHGSRDGAEKFFLEGMKRAMKNMASQASPEIPATIYYAFKQSEIAAEGISSTGWATFLQAVLDAGYAVVGTWPIRTEMASRMRAVGSNALANSVVLVCRRKEDGAETVSRAEFVRALKREVPRALAELQAANIAPADMPQSAIGPGMGVFSRYAAVLESDDTPMTVKAALQLINRELDEYLGGIQGEFDADTRFAISWFEQNGMKAGDYGVANSIAQARGISVESVKHAGIVESAAGRVRILARDELDPDWEPGRDTHLTVWECCQQLVRLHERDGISNNTALLLRKIGSERSDAVKDLAYCLYDISANKRQDAKEATAYNALIADWTELSREAAKVREVRRDGQGQLDL